MSLLLADILSFALAFFILLTPSERARPQAAQRLRRVRRCGLREATFGALAGGAVADYSGGWPVVAR